MSEFNLEAAARTAGEKSSLIEYFEIEGLFGYRSISLSSKYAATILIAKNGTGKTTLLAVMDAFLKGQYGRLTDLDFRQIVCRLKGVKEPLILKKNDIRGWAEDIDRNLKEIAVSNGLDSFDLYSFVAYEYPRIKHAQRDLMENAVFMKIFGQTKHTYNSAKKFFDEMEGVASQGFGHLSILKKQVQDALGDVEIIYLPTYRRIELSLPDTEDSRLPRASPSIRSKLGLSTHALQSDEIQFGLSDISRRLSKLNQEMLVESNQGYREISANIINDLINGAFERDEPADEDLPSKEALSLFFSRLEDGGKYFVPYSGMKINHPERIYDSENVPENSRKFLNYFLGKLNIVIKKTHDVESMVEEFVSNCNRYLYAQDDSVDIPGRTSRRHSSIDGKILNLNKKNLGVSVSSLNNKKRKIPLDSLSSGEKQMISLFAKLYLYPRKKILLIDEPELSLSLSWQRKILLDILAAHSCEQLIAITHSPFVFDNVLEPFALPLKLTIDQMDDDVSEEMDEDGHE